MSKKIRIVVAEPGKLPAVSFITDSLKGMQQIVGGYIELFETTESEIDLFCNEEGKLLGLPLNRALRNDNGDIYDIICGNFIIVGLTEEDFGDLTDEQVEKYTQMFYKKEMFIRKGQRIVSFSV